MKKVLDTIRKSDQRKGRVKAKIHRGGISRPRLSVSKTNKHIFLQIIDDIERKTIVSASDEELKAKGKKRMEIASELGKLIATKSLAKKVKKIVFDRNRYAYHGIVKSIADGAREGGLEF